MSDLKNPVAGSTEETTSYIDGASASTDQYAKTAAPPLHNVEWPNPRPTGITVTLYGSRTDPENSSNSDLLFKLDYPKSYEYNSISCDTSNNRVTCTLTANEGGTDGETLTEYLSVKMVEGYSSEQWEITIGVDEAGNKWNWKFSKKSPMPM